MKSYLLSCSRKRSQSSQCLGFYRGLGRRKWEFVKKKKKKMELDADQEWVLRKAWEHTNTKAHSWWIIPQVCWERSYSEVIQLWHQGFLLCVFRFTITGHMQGWRNSEITQRYKNTCSDARQTKVTAAETLLQTTSCWQLDSRAC